MTAPAPEGAPSSSGGLAFTRKLGPLPMWAWLGIGLALLLVVYTWKNNKAASADTTTAADTSTDSSQIPQFINQTYVQNMPGTTPPPSSGTVPPPSGGGGVLTPPSGNGRPPGNPHVPSDTYRYMHTSGAYDTVAKIAKKYGTSVSTILAYNPGIQEKGWNINKLPTGQILRLPSAATVNAGKMYITTGGQWSTIPRIARHEGVTAQALLAANPQIQSEGWNVHALPPGETLLVPSKAKG